MVKFGKMNVFKNYSQRTKPLIIALKIPLITLKTGTIGGNIRPSKETNIRTFSMSIGIAIII